MTLEAYWKDGGIEIYCGDCRQILPELSSGAATLAITSPPYNIYKQWWDSGISGIPGHKNLMRKFTLEFYPDTRDENEYQAEQKMLIEQAMRIAGCVCYNHKVRYAFKRAGASFHPMSWLLDYPLWVEIIWDRMSGVAFNCRRPIPADERIFVLGKPSKWHDLKLNTVWRILPDTEAPGHPCAFPLELPSRLIAMFTDPGDTVIDYYSGSGTTLVAAKKLGRKAIGIEIEERFCELAVKRLSQSVMDLRL